MEKDKAILSILGLDKEVTNTTEAYELFKEMKYVGDLMEKELKALRLQMFDFIEKETEPDSKGSFTKEFEDGTGYQKQARVSMKILEDKVLEYAKEKNLPELVITTKKPSKEKEEELVAEIEKLKRYDLLDEVQSIDEIELETAVLEGKITMEEFEEMVSRKVTYALIDLRNKRGRK